MAPGAKDKNLDPRSIVSEVCLPRVPPIKDKVLYGT